MCCVKEPPMVILIDILMLFVMMFMLQPESNVRISIPSSDTLPKGVHIVYTNGMHEQNTTVLQIPLGGNRVLQFDETVLQQAGAAYLIACLREKRLCSTAKIPIDRNGQVDFERFYKLNHFDLRR